MTDFLRTDQLDILGFTAEYRFLFLLIAILLVVTFFIVPCIRFFVRRNYISMLGFVLTSCVLSIFLLLYEKHVGMVDIYVVWVKVMAVYSLIYALTLGGKAVRKQKSQPF